MTIFSYLEAYRDINNKNPPLGAVEYSFVYVKDDLGIRLGHSAIPYLLT
ncbi:6105_t:CDS:1, partial [Racocetra fulgida]